MTTRRLPDPILDYKTTTTGEVTSGEVVYVFPPVDGATGTVLTTDGTGQLVWTVAAGAAVFAPTDVYAEYTATTETFIRWRGTAAATITLADNATAVGKQLFIENCGTAAVTIAAAGSDTIDGDAAPIVLELPFDSASLVSDGLGNWLLI